MAGKPLPLMDGQQHRVEHGVVAALHGATTASPKKDVLESLLKRPSFLGLQNPTLRQELQPLNGA
jgi:hypothetical protein